MEGGRSQVPRACRPLRYSLKKNRSVVKGGGEKSLPKEQAHPEIKTKSAALYGQLGVQESSRGGESPSILRERRVPKEALSSCLRRTHRTLAKGGSAGKGFASMGPSWGPCVIGGCSSAKEGRR